MAKYYLPSSEQERVAWTNNFSTKLAAHSAKYGVTAAEKTDMAALAADWAFRVDAFNKVNSYKESWRQYKLELRNGTDSGVGSAIPAAPDFTAAPTPSDPGAFDRLTALVQRIKNHPSYTLADGVDLGIEAPSSGVAGLPEDVKPVITIKTGPGGKPSIIWAKGGADGIAVYKDSGNGFQFYDFDNHPNYDDKAPLPATATTWHYKVIYRKNDEEVGLFSDVQTVHIGS